MDLFALIDGFLKQIAQSRDLLLACGLFMIPLAKRRHFWLRTAVGLVCCLTFSYLVPHSQFSYLLELLAVAATAGLHKWKHNTLLSIVVGTVLYMALLRLL